MTTVWINQQIPILWHNSEEPYMQNQDYFQYNFGGKLKMFSRKLAAFVVRDVKLQSYYLKYTNEKGVSKTRNIGNDLLSYKIDIEDHEYSFTLKNGLIQKKFFCLSFGDLNLWLKALEKQCVHANFYENYKILDIICDSTETKLYKIQSIRDDKLYTCKTFNKKLIEEFENLKENLYFEIKALRKLNHNNIVKLISIYEDEMKVYLILELLDGLSIKQYLKLNARFNEDQAKLIAKKILDVLLYLKKNGIMHRYIKSKNFILINQRNSHNYDIKMIDFGFNMRNDFARFAKISGIPLYSEPKISPDITINDGKLDILSVGILFYTMLSGYNPFKKSNKQDIIKLHCRPIFEFDSNAWQSISENAQDFIKKLTDEDPKNRLNYEEAIEHPWIDNNNLSPLNLRDMSLTDLDCNDELELGIMIEQKLEGKDLISAATKLLQINLSDFKANFESFESSIKTATFIPSENFDFSTDECSPISQNYNKYQ